MNSSMLTLHRMANILVFLGSMTPLMGHAGDLMTIWQAVVSHDLSYQASEAGYRAGQTQKEQASALWRPTVQVAGTAGRMSSQSQIDGAQFSAPGAFPVTNNANFNTSINGGILQRWSLQARQPLLSGDRLAQGQELDLKAQMAELNWVKTHQELLLKTARYYFSVVLAQESLRVTLQQQQEVEQALAEVNRRFQLGDVPVTDTHEVQARREAVAAQVLAAQADLTIKRQALSDITGMDFEQKILMGPYAGVIPDAGAPLKEWLTEVGNQNIDWQTKMLEAEVARKEAKRYGVLASPSVDLVGEVESDHLSGSGDYGAASNSMRSSLVGVQVTIPLYSGGLRSAHHDEKSYQAHQAEIEADRWHQQVLLETRQSWLGVSTGIQRVEALNQAVHASDERVAATRLGQRVGDRSTLDLLNAQSDAASLHLSWLQARIDVVLNRLQLAALSGHLAETDLMAIDQLLSVPPVEVGEPIRSPSPNIIPHP